MTRPPPHPRAKTADLRATAFEVVISPFGEHQIRDEGELLRMPKKRAEE